MKYRNISQGRFIERPNRFIAYVEINGRKETVHVKNTGRCLELLVPGAKVYVQESENPERKTKWDLIAVEKNEKLINMDSQIPNQTVKEWLESGKADWFPGCRMKIRPEYTYGNSRIDLYVEAEEGEKNRRILIEVKGVTLEERGVVRFPDAPSERAVKHVEELVRAVKEGYEAYVFFVIQMKGARYFTPNMDTHPAFGEALRGAASRGVHILAYDCEVTPDSITLDASVPVVLGEPLLFEIREPLIRWYRENKRDLPWRKVPDAYRVWVSEIMLQQTRVEAVKPYYERFLKELPTVQALAEAEEDTLLKLWEGLGYYNRVRNMQKAAQQIMIDYQGKFPDAYEEIRSLKGIGEYTAGAISAFAYGLPKPAVDGNVLRVVSRVLCSDEDIMKQSVRRKVEALLEEVIPEDAASDFNQGLIELGALVCVPNGEPKCGECPLQNLCRAHAAGRELELPVKTKPKTRRIVERTIFIFWDGETVALRKRPAKGLLAGLYELPGIDRKMTQDEVIAYSKKIGLTPVRVVPAGEAKHVFSHVEWHMTGFLVVVDELEKACREEMLFVRPEEVEEKYPVPSAFEKYAEYYRLKL